MMLKKLNIPSVDKPTYTIDRYYNMRGSAIIHSITCKICDKESFNTNDVANCYCGHCDIYHGRQILDNTPKKIIIQQKVLDLNRKWLELKNSIPVLE